MKTHLTRILAIALLLLNGFLFAQTNPNHVWVNGYTKSNGTHVEGHYRTAPNSTNRDNFSTVGNTNPYTGQAGWIPADNNPLPAYNNNTTYTLPASKATAYDVTQFYNSTPNSNSVKKSFYSGVAPSSSMTYYTTTSLRLRGGWSTEDEIILTMPAGSSVEVVNDFDSWAYVYYNGYYGYASSSYLSDTRYVPKSEERSLKMIVPPSQMPSYSNVSNQNLNSTIPSGSSTGKSSGCDNGGTILLSVLVIGCFVWWFKS